MSSFYVITQYIIYDCLFYFNPRSREGSDALTLTALTCPKISIRVPTRGATGMALHHCVGNTISIRAPTRGATTNADRIRSMTDISIRAPARGATVAYELRDSMTRISIRAPARGATSRSVHTRRRINHFNPRSHEGSDLTPVLPTVKQSHFNPRSHEGSDMY